MMHNLIRRSSLSAQRATFAGNRGFATQAFKVYRYDPEAQTKPEMVKYDIDLSQCGRILFDVDPAGRVDIKDFGDVVCDWGSHQVHWALRSRSYSQ